MIRLSALRFAIRLIHWLDVLASKLATKKVIDINPGVVRVNYIIENDAIYIEWHKITA